ALPLADLARDHAADGDAAHVIAVVERHHEHLQRGRLIDLGRRHVLEDDETRSEEHTSELQSLTNLVCRLLLEKKKKNRPPSSQPAPRLADRSNRATAAQGARSATRASQSARMQCSLQVRDTSITPRDLPVLTS